MHELGTTTGHHPVHHHRHCAVWYCVHVHHAVDGYMNLDFYLKQDGDEVFSRNIAVYDEQWLARLEEFVEAEHA
jgi:hypothetical protein